MSARLSKTGQQSFIPFSEEKERCCAGRVLNRTERPFDPCYCFRLGVLMPRRKNIRELGMLTTQNVSDHQYMVPLSVDDIEPELQSFNSERVSPNADYARLASLFVPERKVKIKDYSVSQEWHRPYSKLCLKPMRPNWERSLPRLNGQLLVVS